VVCSLERTFKEREKKDQWNCWFWRASAKHNRLAHANVSDYI